jgi:hypothetical protein
LYYREDSEQVDVCYRPMDKIRPEEQKLFRADINQTYGFLLPDRIVLTDREAAEKLIFEIIAAMEHPGALAFLTAKGLFIQLLSLVLSDAFGENSRVPDSGSTGADRVWTAMISIRSPAGSASTRRAMGSRAASAVGRRGPAVWSAIVHVTGGTSAQAGRALLAGSSAWAIGARRLRRKEGKKW